MDRLILLTDGNPSDYIYMIVKSVWDCNPLILNTSHRFHVQKDHFIYVVTTHLIVANGGFLSDFPTSTASQYELA